MPKKEEYVTISTTFTGDHAQFINELTERYHTTKPNALRIFLNEFITGGVVRLNAELKNRIELLLRNPLVKKQFGLDSTEAFAEYALSRILLDFQRELKDLRDPSVQLMLDEDELEVARVLLRRSETIENYGGITLDELAEHTQLGSKYVKRILDDFIENGWVGLSGRGTYLPIKYLNF